MLDSPQVREYAVAVHVNLPSPTQGHSSTLAAHGVAPRPSREILLVVVFILFNSLSFFLMQYNRMRTTSADLESWVRSVLNGAQPAPDQYSVAIPFIAQFLQIHAHLGIRQSLPLIEFLSYALALTLLYLLFRSSPHVVHARPLNRLVLVGFFLTVAQFPILWIFPWDRPEALLTAFYLAAIVLVVVQRSRVRFGIVCLLAVLLSLGQALVQADVPVAVGVAIFLSIAVAVPFRRPRTQMAILGALCVAVGAAVQLYMRRGAYPNTAYPANISKAQLLTSLNLFYPPVHTLIFLTALLPFIVSMVLLRRHHLRLDASDKLVLVICLVYFPVWVMMGLVVGVRTFIPFLLLLSPTIAKLWGAFLFGERAGPQPHWSASLP
jgi:hypothetical protein